MAHLSEAHRLAAGLRTLPEVSKPFAAAQAAWRFYDNPRVTLPVLAGPLIAAAREGVDACQDRVLVVLDWCLLHYDAHASKTDRVELANTHDLGYELLTALAVSDQQGRPLSPLCLELRGSTGVHTTRSATSLPPLSAVDGLAPVMTYIKSLQLGLPTVYIIDREADSVGHYRQWSMAGHEFIVRANDARYVLHQGREQKLIDIARQTKLVRTRTVTIRDQAATQYTGETKVVLHRPARTHRKIDGKKKHCNIAGEPLSLRLIVSEIRDEDGNVLARWLLLTNLPESISAETIALWYYWRWRIESYHKLLKGAGQQLESWLQDDASQVAARLTIAAIASVVIWNLARDERPEADEMRNILVCLSGRLMKRGKGQRNFTEPALLAGLGVLLPMLHLLEHYSVDQLKHLVNQFFPTFLLPTNTG
jgi:hypothetical protein